MGMMVCTGLYGMHEITIPVHEAPIEGESPNSMIEEIVRTAVFITFDSDPRTVFVSPVIRQALESELSGGSPEIEPESETRGYRQRILQKYIKSNPASIDGLDYIELRQWVLRELKEYNERTQRQVEELKAQREQEATKLEAERKKFRYAVITTVVTTVCGLLTTVTTYLLTHYLGETSDGN